MQNSFDRVEADWVSVHVPVEKAWFPDTPPSDEKIDDKMGNYDMDIKCQTILQNSFDGVDEDWVPDPVRVDEDWVPDPVPEERIADCDKKCLEKVKLMPGKDKCRSQTLRKLCSKKLKPLMNLRLEAPDPEPQETL